MTNVSLCMYKVYISKKAFISTVSIPYLTLENTLSGL